MSSKIAIYPGTFDPINYGQLDIIKRSSNLFDKLIISISNNPNKKPLFSIDDRINMIKNEISTLDDTNLNKLSVKSFKGLLTNFAKQNHASFIIRGLRAVSDFEYEFQMTGMNHNLDKNIDTIFLMSSEKNSFISSNIVKEVHKLGGDVSNYVSRFVINYLDKNNI